MAYNEIKTLHPVGKRAGFNHCEGTLGCEVLAYNENGEVKVHVDGWLGDHWYPIDRLRDAPAAKGGN